MNTKTSDNSNNILKESTIWPYYNSLDDDLRSSLITFFLHAKFCWSCLQSAVRNWWRSTESVLSCFASVHVDCSCCSIMHNYILTSVSACVRWLASIITLFVKLLYKWYLLSMYSDDSRIGMLSVLLRACRSCTSSSSRRSPMRVWDDVQCRIREMKFSLETML